MIDPVSRLRLVVILVGLGIGWGATQPLGKIAASTGHGPMGLVFWQLVTCTVVLGALTLVQGKSLPLHRAALRLDLLDPKLVLQRGFAWLSDAQGSAISSVNQTQPGQQLQATLADGVVDLRVADQI